MGSTTQQAEFTPYKANVNFINETQRKIAIDIGNSGTSSGQIIKFTFEHQLRARRAKTLLHQSPMTIAAGDIESFNVTYPWTHGATYYFKVVLNSGAALSFTVQAPR